ncbi:quinoprotein glucose dehydrogenase [Chitinophaga lutea]|uniref:Quinoprotein glucose dehydrogenase n=1 Tax=Chitinophaga lutea TaxID=2488634 RepID=A0A3N4PNU0_9BACT|nr:PQQ-dependent sugar dehydrogenase [Chitinophaga lutea]RPE09278.1 quinoprotein glucose dehydrogenase [Chitinophaga lutea]
MKRTAVPLLLVLCLALAAYFIFFRSKEKDRPVEATLLLDSSALGITTIASGLNVPWEICWGPDGQIWFTEQSGSISKVDPRTGEKKLLLTIPEVFRKRSLGMLGMAIHPQQPYIFVDYTALKPDSSVVSKLVRYTYTADTLKNPLLLMELPGATGHNGSRVAVSPDGKVIWSTGDATRGANAPDTASPNGKVLRLNTDGSIPADNPYPGNPMWSRGHRNIQGLAYTDKGHLFASEHGDAMDDEINYIQKAAFYGWPRIEGLADRDDEKPYADSFPFTPPAKAWTPTIAPAGIAYYHASKIPEWQNAILMTTLKTSSLRVLQLNAAQDAVTGEKIYLGGIFGRLRAVCVSPDGDVYVATSNRDWNPGKGFPIEADDRIIRISPVAKTHNPIRPLKEDTLAVTLSKGQALYKSYCDACHKADGKGIQGSFPALDGNALVNGKPQALVKIILNGQSGNMKGGEQMPAFKFLSDADVTAIVNYTRKSWSNKAYEISFEDVERFRKR